MRSNSTRVRRTTQSSPLRFDQRLVLNHWLLSLFQVDSFTKLVRTLKDPALETLDENNVSRFHLELTNVLYDLPELPKDVLLGYDQNIVAHTSAINAKRTAPIRWKYFQYLSLLFTEIYLDRYFRDPERLCDDLNAFVARFNAGEFTTGPNAMMQVPLSTKDQIAPYTVDDLKKLAFWNATGSGKTLLMHVNILQYRHYLALHGREKDVNRTILLTPNEGLSRQHLEEFAISGFEAELFNKDGGGLYQGHQIEIIDINKLRDESGDKTVAVDAFEGNNLVLVDEGHRGSSGEEWKDKRDKLCATGFSFEYSATFGQAMKAANKPALTQEYAKCILFDYSYKYFYRDGYGKDYSILNLADDSDNMVRAKYLTASLLAFYQQQRVFEEKRDEIRPYLLERPLWVFVGGSVTRSSSKEDTDIQDILLFLSRFLCERAEYVVLLDQLLAGHPGLLDDQNNEIFADTFTYLQSIDLSGEELYADILARLFNAPASGMLHVENLKGVGGEIALRVGDNEPFGLINVGDDDKLCNKLESENADSLVVTKRDFAQSLFAKLNDSDSTVNLLIGSRKFSEGWSSWRVSSMGLMNIGRKEGSQIIQLFGRGVRLKGYGFSLKRSSALDGRIDPPSYLSTLETLNIFGIRADYMRQFKEYLEEEGVRTDNNRMTIPLPVVPQLPTNRKLKIVRLREGANFKQKGPKPTLGEMPVLFLQHPVLLDWYPKIQSMSSDRHGTTRDTAVREEGKLTLQHLAFMDMDAIYFELERFKNERAWYNLNIPRTCVTEVLGNPDWYHLYIPPDELQFRSFTQVRRWQEIAVALLKKFCDRYYKYKRAEWESAFLEFRELDASDPNLDFEYTLKVDESRETVIAQIEQLKTIIEAGTLREFQAANLMALQVQEHLYHPLLHLSKGKGEIDVSPVALNDGERDFVRDLSAFHAANPQFFTGRELYLLRNMSKGRGMGFFEAGNFYPDFIVWLVEPTMQRIAFVDPKGIRHLAGRLDPKIQFHKTITELQSQLGDPTVLLTSFIISNTRFLDPGWWSSDLTKAEWEECHVLFQEDKSTYIRKMLDRIVEIKL